MPGTAVPGPGSVLRHPCGDVSRADICALAVISARSLWLLLGFKWDGVPVALVGDAGDRSRAQLGHAGG
jgi:hypothetical protein